MKKLAIVLLIIGFSLLNACTRVFYTSQCDCSGKIPDYDLGNPDWKKFDKSIMNTYKGFIIKGGANGIIIYETTRKDHEAFEQVLCEFWKTSTKN